MNRPFPLHIENAILDRAEETSGAAFSLETVPAYVFAYPKEFVTLPEYSRHRGQPVEIVRELSKSEYDFQGEKMFEVRAKDGWSGHAFASEIKPARAS